MDAKEQLRQSFRLRRKAIAPEVRAERSRDLMAVLFALPRVVGARTLLVYEAVGSEVETKSLLDACWRQGKAVALPRIHALGGMDMRVVRGVQELEPGPHGIPHPNPELCPLWKPDPSDVVLVPGVAFTPSGLRLGQGGGYYDRFLGAHPLLWSIGLAFSEQMTTELPRELHDAVLSQVMAA